MLPEIQLEHILGSSLEVNMDQGPFPIDSVNDIQTLCTGEQVVTKGWMRGNWCIWNLTSGFPVSGNVPPSVTIFVTKSWQLQCWGRVERERKESTTVWETWLWAPLWVFFSFVDFKVICYNGIILYNVILFSNTTPTGKSAGRMCW